MKLAVRRGIELGHETPMKRSNGIMVRFWGVRGSIASPGSSTVKYGGNTSCVEVRCGEKLFILDIGSGGRPLGAALAREMPLDADILLSHTHYDHVIGLPFFAPAYVRGNRFRIWAGHLGPSQRIGQVLRDFMSAPFLPVPCERLDADISFNDFAVGDVLTPGGGATIRTTPLNHPDGATGYRIEFEGHTVAYVTDTEHRAAEMDENVLGLIRNADLVIYDSTYTDEEYPRYRGWGHSTWQEGVRLCAAAEAKTLVIFHHNPDHDDRFLDAMAAQAESLRAGTVVAREGMVLTPGRD